MRPFYKKPLNSYRKNNQESNADNAPSPIRPPQRTEIDIPTSIFNLDNPDSHRVIELQNQKIYKALQKKSQKPLMDYFIQ